MKTILSRLLFLSLTLCVIAAGLVGCIAPEDQELPENMQHATAEGEYYRLYLPSDWTLLTATGRAGGYASSLNRVMIYVTVQTAPEGMDVLTYFNQIHSKTISDAFPNHAPEFSDPNNGTLGEHGSISVGFTGQREMNTYRGIDTLCIKDGHVYVLTFFAKEELYEPYLPVWEKVVENFKFSDKPFKRAEPLITIPADVIPPEGMKLASGDDVAYRFFVPTGWVQDTSVSIPSVYFSAQDRTNVTVTATEPDPTVIQTAEQYWEAHLEELETVLDVDDATLKITQTDLDGRKTNIYEYTATLNGKTYRFAQAIAGYGSAVYVVTYTATPEAYQSHYEDYLAMLDAFDFRGN